MLKYLIIQLDDTSVSFCHYAQKKAVPRLMELDILKQGIMFAMKENLNIQFIYPYYELPKEYSETIESIDHVKIISSLCEDEEIRNHAEIVVFDEWSGVDYYKFQENQVYVLRTSKDDFFDRYKFLISLLKQVKRFNVVIADIDAFSEKDISAYKDILSDLAEDVSKLFVNGQSPQLNLLTDRLVLKAMNNCNAGDETLTLAPNGKFYICPAFYQDYPEESCGDLVLGISIKNRQLYRLDHAPICRHCDAYQCRRCVWLNRKTTLEVNTPSHEQCVVAHLERNTSHKLLDDILKTGEFMLEITLPELDYMDPFDKHNEW